MTDNVILNVGTGGDTVALEDIGGVKYELIKLVDATAGSTTRTGIAANPLRVDVTGATTQPVSGTVAVSGSVAVTGTFWQATQPVSIAATVTVQATDLDIRSLAFGADSVDVSGSIVAVTGTVAANAGTNLNTSLLALEAGGNLAALVAKDYATQTTLALIKAKTDNLDVTLSGGGTHVIVDTMPPVTAESSATATEESPEYTEDVAEPLSQDLAGNLRTRVSGLVSESPQSYIEGEIRPLSLTNDGRLRTTFLEAATWMNLFDFSLGSAPGTDQENCILQPETSPYGALNV